MRRVFLALGFAVSVVALGVADDYTSPAWRDSIAKGFLPYRKLTAEDFPVASNPQQGFAMYTHGFIHYHFNAKWVEKGSGATATVTDLSVRSGFDKGKSWRRKNFSDSGILAHEQIHLDINEIHAERFRRHQNLPVGKGIDYQEAMNNLRTRMKTLAEEFIREAQEEHNRYDEQTNHGRNKQKQAEWASQIERRRQEMTIRFWDER